MSHPVSTASIASPSRGVAGFGGLLALVLACGPAVAAPATTADDVCASNANPCNVTGIIDVANNATLDFGTRTVNVSGSGQFNFDKGNGTILCGPLAATTTAAAINAKGSFPAGGTRSGHVVLEARRTCSSALAAVPCVDLTDCQIGPCGVRRCSAKTTQLCTSDANCQLGTCNPVTVRCTGSPTFLRCATNADCDYGTCPSQLTCADRARNPVSCAANADCDFGACSVGNASISLDGSIAGNSDTPASITLRAADSVDILKPVNLASTSIDSDGGDIDVEAADGSVQIISRLTLSGGAASTGGVVTMTAAVDVTLGEEIDVTGGDSDGGTVDVFAGRDITVGQDINANAVAGAGFGGAIRLNAGRDLTINAVSESDKTLLQTSGHTDVDNFAGGGGIQALTAGRDVSLDGNTRLVGNGSKPDGFGASMFIDVGRKLLLDGVVEARSVGSEGTGGSVAVVTAGDARVGVTGGFDLHGGLGGGGSVDFKSGGDIAFLGTADATGGFGGSVALDSGGTATLSGALHTSGPNAAQLSLRACHLTLAPSGLIDNDAMAGQNVLEARAAMELEAGSEVLNLLGANIFRYRNASDPPIIDGTVTPAPLLVLDPTIARCAACGDGTVDPSEQCDDGNLLNGDGCDANCQLTGCGNGVVTGGEACDDGNAVDGDCCSAGCLFEAGGSPCDDGEGCTAGDTCDGAGACAGTAAFDPFCLVPDPGSEGSGIRLRSGVSSSRRLGWNWGEGSAITRALLGDPTASDDYAFCVFAADGVSSSVVLSALAPSGAAWAFKADKSLKYTSSDLRPDGIKQILVKLGDAGRGMIRIKGRGAMLRLSGLGFGPSATISAELRNVATGACFGATYTHPFRIDDTGRFEDRTD